MREPTKDERARELSVLYTWLGDVVTISLLVIFAILTGSLTLLSEGIRGVLMLGVTFYSVWVLYAVHRDRLTRYEYGTGKIEQFVSVVVGLGLVLSGFWVAQTVVDTIFLAKPAAGPLDLTSAAIVNSINTLVNVLGWFAMVAASGAADSEVFRAQLRARFTMLVSSLFVQATLTVAALAKDDAIALILDAVGAIFVTCLMLFNGFSMMARALPSLLDAPASTKLGALIRRAVAGVMPEDDIVSIRTRRSGRAAYAQVTLSGAAVTSVAALRDRTTAINDALRREGAEVDLTVVVTSEDLPVQSES
jgi:divalent metal cation (Fe/Co/Zn/Cd) transporter